jgi:hypothetical protein
MGGYGFDADLSLTWLGQLLGDKKMLAKSKDGVKMYRTIGFLKPEPVGFI